MLKAFKTEIDPTFEQRDIINRTIGTCRYVYNLYITHNKEEYTEGNSFMDSYEFSKWLNILILGIIYLYLVIIFS